MGILKDIADAAFGVSSSSQTAGKQRCCSAVALDPHCEQAEAALAMPPMIAEMHKVHVAAKASKYTNFLGDVSADALTAEGIEPNKCKSTGDIQCGSRHGTSFTGIVPIGQGPTLAWTLKLRNMYTSPDIYSTNLAEQEPVLPGWYKFAGLFSLDYSPAIHPFIRFKGMKKWIHCHMVNTETGEIFWDANYNLRMGLGSYYLTGVSPPNPLNMGMEPIFRKFWIPSDEAGPTMFDLALATQDNWYPDQMDTPWGDDEGWDNLHGHDAHVGVEVRRPPQLVVERDMGGYTTGRVVQKDCGSIEGAPNGVTSTHKIGLYPGASTEPCHNDNYERLLRGEEDFLPPYSYTGFNWDVYYGWIKKRTGRTDMDPITKQRYGWMFAGPYGDYRQPQLYEMYHYVNPLYMRIQNRDFMNFKKVGDPISGFMWPAYMPFAFGNIGQLGKPLDIWRREHKLGYNDERSWLEGPPLP